MIVPSAIAVGVGGHGPIIFEQRDESGHSPIIFGRLLIIIFTWALNYLSRWLASYPIPGEYLQKKATSVQAVALVGGA